MAHKGVSKDEVAVGGFDVVTASLNGETQLYPIYEKAPGDFYVGSMPVNPGEGFRGKELQLLSFERPHMRAFHFAWLSFFFAFVCWSLSAPVLNQFWTALERYWIVYFSRVYISRVYTSRVCVGVYITLTR
jgi:hypothetical protein